MNNDQTSFSPLYSIVILVITTTHKQLIMNREIAHWEKVTELWLLVFPKQVTPLLSIIRNIGVSPVIEQETADDVQVVIITKVWCNLLS